MSKRHSAKYKLDRRMGENIWGRPKSPINSRSYGPGQHGQRRKSKVSDFGLQLRAKQKLKGYYGNLTEKQFSRTYEEAARRRGNTAEKLIGLLESRLDAIVYRAKFVPTPFAARQFVNHGHILVNGKRVDIPSYQTKAGQSIEISVRARENDFVKSSLETAAGRGIPQWLTLDASAFKGAVIAVPSREDVPLDINEQLIVELYSK
jgi:small subunit ribosomal protein S4